MEVTLSSADGVLTHSLITFHTVSWGKCSPELVLLQIPPGFAPRLCCAKEAPTCAQNEQEGEPRPGGPGWAPLLPALRSFSHVSLESRRSPCSDTVEQDLLVEQTRQSAFQCLFPATRVSWAGYRHLGSTKEVPDPSMDTQVYDAPVPLCELVQGWHITQTTPDTSNPARLLGILNTM